MVKWLFVVGSINSLALDFRKITLVLKNPLDEADAHNEPMTCPATKVTSSVIWGVGVISCVHVKPTPKLAHEVTLVAEYVMKVL